MDTSHYIDIFIEESEDHLDVLSNQLLALEKSPAEKEIIEEIFRAAHTLKGMAATMGYTDLATTTHQLENVFDSIRYDRITVQPEMIDILFDTVDHLNEMVVDIAGGGSGERDVVEITKTLSTIENDTFQDEEDQPTIDTKTDAAERYVTDIDDFELTILTESIERGFTNYEIHVQLQEDCLLKGVRVFMVFEALEALGEVIKSEPTVVELEEEQFEHTFTVLLITNESEEKIASSIKKISEIEDVQIRPFSTDAYKEQHEQVAVHKKEEQPTARMNQSVSKKTVRVSIDRLDALMNLFEELVIDRSRLETISEDLQHKALQETVERMTRVSSDLQDIILTMRMVPIDQVFNRFPRMIRQLARELDKDVALEIIGADTELDRTVIDEIGDPLVHLIRNAMDHGIESRDSRVKNGKPEQGTITLEAYHSGNSIIIEITDDGAGIDKERVVQKALANNIITQEESQLLSEKQTFELLLASGFSTSDSISEVSGRGVGLDVVKNTIETLGGRISIDAVPGEGSTFTIQLPLTLSIISVLLIRLGDEKYAIPLSTIIETAIIPRGDILHAHNKQVIESRGQIVPLIFLDDVFNNSEEKSKQTSEFVSIVIVRKGDKLAGLVVDAFIGQQEVVLKSLGAYLSNTYAISGATILGDGEVALIVDSNVFIH